MKASGLLGGSVYSLPHAHSSGPLAVCRVARHWTPTFALMTEKLMSLELARHRPLSLVPTYASVPSGERANPRSAPMMASPAASTAKSFAIVNDSPALDVT